MDKRRITLPETTVPFWNYSLDGVDYYEFDTSLTQPPEPMINLMHALKLLDSKDKRVVMINMQEPTPFYPRIADEVEWEVTPLENGDVKIVFSIKL